MKGRASSSPANELDYGDRSFRRRGVDVRCEPGDLVAEILERIQLVDRLGDD